MKEDGLETEEGPGKGSQGEESRGSKEEDEQKESMYGNIMRPSTLYAKFE